MSRTYVSNEDFCKAMVRASKTGQSTKEVAVALGIEAATVNSRAAKLRKGGVPLPKLASERKKVDFEALAKMVSDYEAEEQVEQTEVRDEVQQESEAS
jgi:transposase